MARKKVTTMATADQLFELNARQNEILCRIKAGNLSIEEALAGTQAVLGGIFSRPVDDLWLHGL